MLCNKVFYQFLEIIFQCKKTEKNKNMSNNFFINVAQVLHDLYIDFSHITDETIPSKISEFIQNILLEKKLMLNFQFISKFKQLSLVLRCVWLQ